MDPISSNINGGLLPGKARTTPAQPEREAKLKKVCADFEAMLVFHMLKAMRQTIPQNGLFKPSQGRATFEMMLDQKIADEAARKGEGRGLQEALYGQLTRSAEKKD
jgi:flagellar protein FlgJ